ncbi:hypothetical protein LARV_00676 [Longilinea arvoryzae]|uniref:Lipoprotein n=1 Tax=Longilinea arvoryzae TaxID=360412 RepID=A0A0S7BFR2_9CHLR|nr:hypothetical protein [Longilinea arvoryzae]GAP12936.1 hypothetical protein LARV_00676 [Longilinea arvoryzae]
MKNTSPIIVFLLILALLLSGCSSNAATSSSTTPGASSGKSATLTLKDKLAVGTLKLEGTDLAVTAEQAKTLLPLWKAVKSLSSSSTASQPEIDAVYQQIQDALTADQLASIEKLDLSGENMQALMTELGIDPGANGGSGLTDSAKATRVAELKASGSTFPGGGGNMPSGGGAPSGGSMPSGGGSMPSGGGNFTPPDQAGGTTTQSTPQAGQTGGRGGGMGMSSMFIEPLIKLLETRAAE